MRHRTIVVSLACVAAILAGAVARGQNQGPNEWPTYGQDSGAQRFSSLTQVNRSNVSRLTVAWTSYNTSGQPQPEGGAAPGRGGGGRGGQVTPLMAAGMMYLPTPSRKVVALDPTTGKEIWSQDAQCSSRGAEYWPGDATHQAAIICHSGGRIISLDAKTGKPNLSFGTNGIVTSTGGASSSTSPPLVHKNVIIAAANPNNDGRPEDIRGFDVVTGKQLWRFNTMPQEGEPGFGTWPAGAESRTLSSGTSVGVWGFMSVDARRDILYVPLDSPQWERWGGDRIGDNLFGDSIVAINALTGKYLWHFQVTRHDLWDLDLVGAPVLFDVRQGGTVIPAVGVIGKSGLLFILDRVTGRPIFGVEEMPVAQSDVPGEQTAQTQPIPIKPTGVARTTISKNEIAKVTSELFEACTKLVEENDIGFGGPYNPPGFNRPTVNFPGANGSSNWGGMSFDPTLGYLFVNTQDLGQITSVGLKGGAVRSNGTAGVRAGNSPSVPYDMVGLNGRFAITSPVLLPCQEPPWGSLTAINVNTGDIAWRVPLGITASFPADKQNTGRPNLGGSIATAGGLVFIGASDDSYFRAFDSRTGSTLWEQKVAVSARTVPMTYMGQNGKQYVVVAIGENIVAYALP